MPALTIPNLLTFGRMVLTVFFFSAGLQNDWPWALTLFVIAALTDMVDGTIARLLHQKSRFGAFMDPVADKLMMLAGVVLLTISGTLPWWLMALIVGRDLHISLGFLYLSYRSVPVEFRPTILSKLTTLFQILAIAFGFVVASLEAGFTLPAWILPFANFLPWVIIVTALLTAITAVQYTVIGLRMLRRHFGGETEPS